MKTMSWLFAGAGAAAAIAYLMYNQPRMQSETGWDSVENTADRAFGWGSKSRLAGAGRNMAGRVKEGLGRFTGNSNMADEGVADQAIGTARNAAGNLAQAAGETIHDLNR